jgi:AraC-like DNA-binding protein
LDELDDRVDPAGDAAVGARLQYRRNAVTSAAFEIGLTAQPTRTKLGLSQSRLSKTVQESTQTLKTSWPMIPCYSGRFIEPYAQLLETYESYPTKSLQKLKSIDPDARIPMDVAHRLALDQVEQTGDPDIGLKAARLMPFGRAGALTYAIHTAATLYDAIQVSARFAHLFCDGTSIHLDVEDHRARVRFGSTTHVPRAVADFSMSRWYFAHAKGPAGRGGGFECWFSWPKPANTTEYDRTFCQSDVRFGAPFDGLIFSRDCLDLPLLSADRALHAMLCEHLALTTEHLARRRTVAGTVRDLLMRELLHTTPSTIGVAQHLRMSVRTLGRRLEREGTTFSAVLDDLRRDLALRYVGNRDVSLRDIPFRLRFSHPEAFGRAFKRWTGLTPMAYRRWKATAQP